MRKDEKRRGAKKKRTNKNKKNGPCRQAQAVELACKEMGLSTEWKASVRTESEYLRVWEVERPHSRVWVRFSNHKRRENRAQFEVAYSQQHEGVDGDYRQAIEWIARSFGRTTP